LISVLSSIFHLQSIFTRKLISFVKILLLISVDTAFKYVDLLFSCNIENYLEYLQNFLISKDVILEKGCKDSRKRLSFCFNLACIFCK